MMFVEIISTTHNNRVLSKLILNIPTSNQLK